MNVQWWNNIDLNIPENDLIPEILFNQHDNRIILYDNNISSNLNDNHNNSEDFFYEKQVPEEEVVIKKKKNPWQCGCTEVSTNYVPIQMKEIQKKEEEVIDFVYYETDDDQEEYYYDNKVDCNKNSSEDIHWQDLENINHRYRAKAPEVQYNVDHNFSSMTLNENYVHKQESYIDEIEEFCGNTKSNTYSSSIAYDNDKKMNNSSDVENHYPIFKKSIELKWPHAPSGKYVSALDHSYMSPQANVPTQEKYHSSSLYNVPKQVDCYMSPHYNVPKQERSYSSSVYNVPKQDDCYVSPHYNVPKQESHSYSLYNVPKQSNCYMSPQYDVPKQEKSYSSSVYNVPKQDDCYVSPHYSVSNQEKSISSLYNVPKQDICYMSPLYDVPKQEKSYSYSQYNVLKQENCNWSPQYNLLKQVNSRMSPKYNLPKQESIYASQKETSYLPTKPSSYMSQYDSRHNEGENVHEQGFTTNQSAYNYNNSRLSGVNYVPGQEYFRRLSESTEEVVRIQNNGEPVIPIIPPFTDIADDYNNKNNLYINNNNSSYENNSSSLNDPKKTILFSNVKPSFPKGRIRSPPPKGLNRFSSYNLPKFDVKTYADDLVEPCSYEIEDPPSGYREDKIAWQGKTKSIFKKKNKKKLNYICCTKSEY